MTTQTAPQTIPDEITDDDARTVYRLLLEFPSGLNGMMLLGQYHHVKKDAARLLDGINWLLANDYIWMNREGLYFIKERRTP